MNVTTGCVRALPTVTSIQLSQKSSPI